MVESNQEIWKIFGNQDQIVFQSFSNIYLYDYDETKTIIPSTNIMLGTDVDGDLYVPMITNGLYELVGEKWNYVEPTNSLPLDSIIAALSKGNNECDLYLATQHYGIYCFTGKEVFPVEMPINEKLKIEQVNRMIKLKSGDFVFGTEAVVYINGEVAVQGDFPGIDWTDCDVITIMSGAPRFAGWGHLSDSSYMDELRLFNKALTKEEVSTIINDEN